MRLGISGRTGIEKGSPENNLINGHYFHHIIFGLSVFISEKTMFLLEK